MYGKLQNNEIPSNFDLVLWFLQVFDVLLNVNQISNDVLFQELQKQNKEYLEKIIKQNDEIIELLKNKV